MQAMAFATVGDREPERAPGEGMHPSVFNMALAALANLAAEPSNADLIGEEDGVEMTVEAVSAALDSASVHGEEPDQEMLLHAAEVLRNLASSAMNRQRIVRSGGMGLVVGEAAGSPACAISAADDSTRGAGEAVEGAGTGQPRHASTRRSASVHAPRGQWGAGRQGSSAAPGAGSLCSRASAPSSARPRRP